MIVEQTKSSGTEDQKIVGNFVTIVTPTGLCCLRDLFIPTEMVSTGYLIEQITGYDIFQNNRKEIVIT